MGLRAQLGGKRCPDDTAFASALASEPLYSTAEKDARLRLVLERLERSFNHKEPAELAGAQIEHVMPQTLNADWLSELGDGAEEQWNQLVHTLGNLTLTRYNAELSNRPFAEKRTELANSHFVLNDYFAGVPRWSADAIRQRGRELAQRALTIWKDVGRGPAPVKTERQPGVVPIRVRFRNAHEDVVSWRDGFIKLLTLFEASRPGLLRRIAAERTLHAAIATEGGRFHRSKAEVGGVYINTHGSADQLHGWCRKVATIGGIGEHEFEFVLPGTPPTSHG
jgi:hypothetical protein